MDDDGPRRRFRHQRPNLYPSYSFFFARFPTRDRYKAKALISLAFPPLLPSIRGLL